MNKRNMKDVIKMIITKINRKILQIINKTKRDKTAPNYRDLIFDFTVTRVGSLSEKRILEIGPKDGHDTRNLASLSPAELILLDIPSEYTINVTSKSRAPREKLPQWFNDIELENKQYIEGNLLYICKDELDALSIFDLIWCTGVLYHNPEQLRFMKRLFNLLKVGGILVLESSVTRNKNLKNHNCVEILWPKSEQALKVSDDDEKLIESMITPSSDQSMSIKSNISHMPSRLAVLSWLEMVGFKEIEEINTIEGRMAALAKKTEFPGYTYSNRGPKPSPYILGESK